jgi:hypothetical protein
MFDLLMVHSTYSESLQKVLKFVNFVIDLFKYFLHTLPNIH